MWLSVFLSRVLKLVGGSLCMMRCELVLVVWEPRDASSGRNSELRSVLLVSQVPDNQVTCADSRLRHSTCEQVHVGYHQSLGWSCARRWL